MRCLTPAKIPIKDKEGSHRYVSCGFCLRCLKKRAKHWTFRIQQQQKLHNTAHFVTMTYSDENLVWGRYRPTLYKRHVQLYLKKIRKALNTNIKYYAVGEYGEEEKRPHYHLIIFDAEPNTIIDKWEHGHVYIGEVSEASIQYVTNYILKPKMPKSSYLEREFSLMSKGIGKNYLTNAQIKHHKKSLNGYITDNGGIKKSIPRYYKERLYSSDEYEAVKEKYQNLSELKPLQAKINFDKIQLDKLKFYKLTKSRQ